MQKLCSQDDAATIASTVINDATINANTRDGIKAVADAGQTHGREHRSGMHQATRRQDSEALSRPLARTRAHPLVSSVMAVKIGAE